MIQPRQGPVENTLEFDPMDTGVVEEQFMTAADGDADGAEALCCLLESVPSGVFDRWPDQAREVWTAGAELFCESTEITAGSPPWVLRLFLALARLGQNLPLLRDRLAQAARQSFRDYPDPSGLLHALGIHEHGLSVLEIYRRWQLFEAIKPGRICWLPAQGLGTVVGLDPVCSEVKLQFTHPRGVSLQVCLASLVLVAPDTLLATLAGKRTTPPVSLAGAELQAELLQALIPSGRLGEKDLEALLVPSVWTAAEFQVLFCPEEARAGSETAGGTEPQWAVDQARDLQELIKAVIGLSETWQAAPAEATRIIELLRAAAVREKQEKRVVEAVSHLHEFCRDEEWWNRLLRELGGTATCWGTPETFVRLSMGLTAKLQGLWFEAAIQARGPEWFATASLGLPLRILARAAEMLDAADQRRILLDSILGQVRVGNASADLVVWLWSNGGSEREALRNPSLLFRALSADSRRGPFIEARKNLRKMLVDNVKFQAFMVRDGDPEAAGVFVRSVRHTPALTPGERQSVLVKLVRLFPQLKSVVEQKNVVHAAPTQRPQTSFRSYELRRRELEEVINVGIPANSRAIAHARSFGDLRENAEFKTAKEEQRRLERRRTDLEQMLHDTTATDFSGVQIENRVLPGCTVVLDCGDRGDETYHLLGLWDSDPELRILAYSTAMGQVLLGRAAGDTVELPDSTAVVIREVCPLSEEMRAWVRGEDLH